MDVVQLNEFYASVEGKLATKAIMAALSRMWQPIDNERLVGMGYAIPYLETFGPDCERVINFMTPAIGAVPWPQNQECKTAMVDEINMPLCDDCVDRFLIVHGFEHSENPLQTLQEIYRVLTPKGKLIMVVPNRKGLWAGIEKNPFAWGRPWSRGQLIRTLQDAMFTPVAWSSALHFPPINNRIVLKGGKWIEKMGNRFLSPFGGVLIVEAQKEIYQGIKVKKRKSVKVFIPTLAPQNVPSAKES